MYTYTHDKHQHDLRQMQRSLAAAQHEAEVARKELHELRQSMIAALQHQIFLTGRIEGAAITGDRDRHPRFAARISQRTLYVCLCFH